MLCTSDFVVDVVFADDRGPTPHGGIANTVAASDVTASSCAG